MPVDIGDDDPVTTKLEVVYFIRNEADRRVKVGYTTNLWKRFTDLKTASGAKLTLAFWCSGDRKLEAAIHDFLKPYRLSGEWFSAGAHIEDLIDEISDFLSEKADDEDTRNVPLLASELQEIIKSQIYGLDDADISRRRKSSACGNNVDNGP